MQAHVLREAEDIFYLRFEELREVVRTGQVDNQVIQRRRDDFTSYQTLTPPRVITSDGEVVVGTYGRVDALPVRCWAARVGRDRRGTGARAS